MYRKHVHRGPSPLGILVLGILLFWLVGFKMFFFIPLFFIFWGFKSWGCGTHFEEDDWTDEKPKRKSKPKRDSYIDDDSDDVTYI